MTYREAFMDGYNAALEQFSSEAVSNKQMLNNINLNCSKTWCPSGRRADRLPRELSEAELTSRIRQRELDARSRDHRYYSDIVKGEGRPY